MRQLLSAGGAEVLATYQGGVKKFNLTERLQYFADFAGERVPMTPEDRNKIKKAANANSEFASLILLGFKNKDAIPFFHSLELAYFIYPNDDVIQGSCAAFAHLHASMLRKGVLAIGEMLTRTTATSRLVAIFPLEEEVEEVEGDDEAVALVRPPGMAVVSLPFEDEIRALEPDAAMRALETENGEKNLSPEEVVSAFMELVKKQTISDVELGEDFTNASLTNFWDYVEHVALDEPLTERTYDTIVDEKELVKVLGDQIEALKLCIPENEKVETASRKRKLEPDDSGIDWEAMYTEGKLEKCKNADLKKKLKSVGAAVGGKKSELVLRVSNILEKEIYARSKKEE